jgi:subtilisin family serine protease
MKKLVILFVMTLLIATTIPSVNGCIIKSHNLMDFQDHENIPGEFIVKFRTGVKISSPSISILNEKYQVKSIEKVFINSEGTILDNIYKMTVPKESDILSIVNDYASCKDVEYAETNGLAKIACGIPNDENFSKQWSLDNTGQTGGISDCDIDGPEVWDMVTGNSDLVIAVIDSGIDYTHPDFDDNLWSNEDEIPDNGIDDDENGFIDDVKGWDWWDDENDPLDEMGHGTACAGVVGAVGNNGIGIAGVCWDCKIMPLKIMNDTGWCYYIDIANSIEYAADNGADVISMSLGVYSHKKYIENAVNYAYGKGVFIAAAVGNDGISSKLYPAAYDNVTAVGGTNHNDSRMHYFCPDCQVYHTSNYGPWVDVAAPARDIYTTMPTYNVYFNDLGTEQNYDTASGTSYASPHVAGVAALMLSKDSALTPDELKSRIRKYVDPYDSDEYIGTGRINAHKAVKNTRPRISLNTIFTNNAIFKMPLFSFLQSYSKLFPILKIILQ